MRGKRGRGRSLTVSPRNIPAYAGKTMTNQILTGNASEHPRVCGENFPPLAPCLILCGTSPRMRGKRSASRFDNSSCRNIPAYAGKTIFHLVGRHLSREHPRVCGENDGTPTAASRQAGTSPRMRGKHPEAAIGAGRWRNIPAYAGKTHQ